MSTEQAEDLSAYDVPEGFKFIKRGGPFLHAVGKWFYKRDEKGQIVLGTRIGVEHTNIRNIAHGGALLTMIDSALGMVLSSHGGKPQPMVTVSLSTEFIESARPGDWVEAHVDVVRVGKRLAYGNCTLWVGERRIMTGSGVFAVMPPIVKPEDNPPSDG